jgi:hypothetical protein
MKSYMHLWQYLAESFLKWKTFHTEFVEEIKTHFIFDNIFFSPKIMSFMR